MLLASLSILYLLLKMYNIIHVIHLFETLLHPFCHIHVEFQVTILKNNLKVSTPSRICIFLKQANSLS